MRAHSGTRWVVAAWFAAACGGAEGPLEETGGPGPDDPALDCAEVLTCVEACATDADRAGCEASCADRVTVADAAPWTALAACDLAQACAYDRACLELGCGPELQECVGGGGGGTTPADTLPARYVGAVIDETPDLIGMHLLSTGDAVFVRDEAGDSGGFAFYRLESITYLAEASGGSADCTYAASEEITFVDPPSAGNHVQIEIEADDDGARRYEVVTTLSELVPDALTVSCKDGGFVTDFNAENNVASGVPMPTTLDLSHLQATVDFGSRIWSWDLHGEE